MVDNWNILKLTEPFFSGKFTFTQIWAKCSQTSQTAGFFKMKYLKKEVDDEVYSLHTNKHRSLLQVDTIILDECNQVFPKYPK